MCGTDLEHFTKAQSMSLAIGLKNHLNLVKMGTSDIKPLKK